MALVLSGSFLAQKTLHTQDYIVFSAGTLGHASLSGLAFVLANDQWERWRSSPDNTSGWHAKQTPLSGKE